MRTARPDITRHETAGNPDIWIQRGLEFCWLLAVVMIPLAFLGRNYVLSEGEISYVDLPKTALLRTLAGLTASLWLLDGA